jgi:DNA-binding transcriptional LysR family regulator
MELRQLRHFLGLSGHKSFNRAASHLGLTQQALSHSIAQLEKDLGARLFERTSQGVQLTDVGVAFEKRARLALAELDLATREANALKDGFEGQVRLGASSAIAARLLPKAVEKFAKARPKVTLRIAVDHSRILYDKLLSGDLDLVVSTPVINAMAIQDLTHEPIEGFEFDANFLVMRSGHPLLQKKDPTLAQAMAYPWVLPETLGDFSRTLFDYLHSQGVSAPKYIVRTDSFWGGEMIIRGTDFVALTGRDPAADLLDAGLLGGFPLPGLHAKLPGVCSYRRLSPLQPAASVLLQSIHRIMRGPAQTQRRYKDQL